MTRKMKVVLIFTHIAVLAVGLVVGFYSSFVKSAQESTKMASQVAMISHYAILVDVARNDGDRDAYKKSLLAFLTVLEEIIKQPSQLFDAKTTFTDEVFVYERLSRLERETVNTKAAEDYLRLAVQTCGKSGLKDCSVEKISTISKKIEESSMIPPKIKENSTKH